MSKTLYRDHFAMQTAIMDGLIGRLVQASGLISRIDAPEGRHVVIARNIADRLTLQTSTAEALGGVTAHATLLTERELSFVDASIKNFMDYAEDRDMAMHYEGGHIDLMRSAFIGAVLASRLVRP